MKTLQEELANAYELPKRCNSKGYDLLQSTWKKCYVQDFIVFIKVAQSNSEKVRFYSREFHYILLR